MIFHTLYNLDNSIQPLVVSGQWSVVSGQRSAVSGQLLGYST
ncbi:hypothetical protein [Moorena sp. SIO1G6]|nr:hypothetical protein [Moorena sp. SIO1G6]